MWTEHGGKRLKKKFFAVINAIAFVITVLIFENIVYSLWSAFLALIAK